MLLLTIYYIKLLVYSGRLKTRTLGACNSPFIESPETSLLSKNPGTLQRTLVLPRSAVDKGGFNHVYRRGETSGHCTRTHCTEEVEWERVLHPSSPQDGRFHGVVGHHFSDVADGQPGIMGC